MGGGAGGDFGGIDFSKLGGAGMEGMGDMGEEADEDEDDDMPALEGDEKEAAGEAEATPGKAKIEEVK